MTDNNEFGWLTTRVQVLKQAETKIQGTIEKNFDPKKFFKDRDGLFVWNSFESRILESIGSEDVAGKYTVQSFDLVTRSNDKQIGSVLAPLSPFTFGVDYACATIADLITKQSKGVDGPLLTDGNFNLFYTPSFVVSVHRDGGGWFVGAWERGDRTWFAGRRVFSPATEL